MYIDFRINSPYSCQVLTKLEFSRLIFEKYTKLVKILPVTDEFYAEGQTDMTQIIVAFLSFANAPKSRAIVAVPLSLCTLMYFCSQQFRVVC
jgi:hypothetical protein